MIEVRIDLIELRKIKHDVLHSITMIEVLKKAGIPIDGVLLTRGVTRGTLVWSIEEDLDGETWVIRWCDDSEDFAMRGPKQPIEATGAGQAFTWKRYRNPNKPVEDEEL